MIAGGEARGTVSTVTCAAAGARGPKALRESELRGSAYSDVVVGARSLGGRCAGPLGAEEGRRAAEGGRPGGFVCCTP